jgi:serine/threonine protein kinase
MSPERLLGEQYDASGDIWSVGIMMVQLWTKKYPFEDNISTPIDLLTELEGLRIDRLLQENKFPRSMGKVVRAMMASDPAGRASCMELLEFSWFQESQINSITDAQQVQYSSIAHIQYTYSAAHSTAQYTYSIVNILYTYSTHALQHTVQYSIVHAQ